MPNLEREQAGSSGISHAALLEGARDLTIRDGVFVAVGRDQINNYAVNGGTPLEKLLAQCVIEATHESETAAYAPRCKAGTRREILRDMRSWLTCASNDRLPVLTLLWLSGPAGGRKSCIQRELVEICKEKEVLAASYFFSTRVENLDSARPFVATLAIQLCGCIPGYKPLVKEEILNDVSLFEKSMEVQFERLISVPLQRINSASPHPAEPITTPYTQPLLSKPQSSSEEAPPSDWNEGRTKSHPLKRSLTSTLGLSTLLRLLPRAKPQAIEQKGLQPVDSAKVTADLLSQIDKINCLPPHADSGSATSASKPELRNYHPQDNYHRRSGRVSKRKRPTSRPEFDIRSTFEDEEIEAITYRIMLESYGCDTDIESYLIETILEIRKKHPSSASIPRDWPSQEDIQKVVRKSSGQFIYASTFLTFIDNPRRNLVEMFDLAVNFVQTPSTTLNPFATLDALYTCILDAADADISLLKRLLHAMVDMASTGTITTDAMLDESFVLPRGTTATTFCDLHSIIRISAPHASINNISFHHKSIEDYLLSPQRSGKYHQKVVETNRDIFDRCIDCLSPWADKTRLCWNVPSYIFAVDYASRRWHLHAGVLLSQTFPEPMTSDAVASLPTATMVYRHWCGDREARLSFLYGPYCSLADKVHAELVGRDLFTNIWYLSDLYHGWYVAVFPEWGRSLSIFQIWTYVHFN
ncbi:hypothetical protein FA15DRAFT_706020 [Coprinopsis marcescibilis]|uniref:Nephrocystin 3-like N-terminal domain-containing protein n=1 Tax=Coprinopsis marcescibilis TaxID=230819 RepID=A0A5C3KQE9_COPMA|nr:hypothetical protein FA15DRAFT_706020 [Coprinopsis marcescibilis]